MTPIQKHMSKIERKAIADLLWFTVAEIEKGATTDWTVERLKNIAWKIEPFLSEYEEENRA